MIKIIDYRKDRVNHFELPDLNFEGNGDYNSLGIDIDKLLNRNSNSWIYVTDDEIDKRFGEIFNLNPMIIESLAKNAQRQTLEVFDDQVFLNFTKTSYDIITRSIHTYELSFILSKNALVTRQGDPQDTIFQSTRDRIKNGKRIREKGLDYLLYCLLDVLMEQHRKTITMLGEEIEKLEEDIISQNTENILESIKIFRKDINKLRRIMRPLNEYIRTLSKIESEIFDDETYHYFNDLLNQITLSNELLVSFQENLTDQLNIYHANFSMRLNENLRVLTLFSVMFIPLTFLTGVYGTNFPIPELHFQYSYLIFWLVILGISTSMFIFFKRKKWL